MIDRPETLARLDRSGSAAFAWFGDLRRPQTPALGFTPAQARAKGQALVDSFLAALAFTLRVLSGGRKGK